MMNMKVTLQLLKENYELFLVITILRMLNMSIAICIVAIIKLSLAQKLQRSDIGTMGDGMRIK